MVDRWLFRRALVGRWKSIGGALANRSSSRPPTPLQGRCKTLAWDHARGCAVVIWLTAFNARPHHQQWVWPPRSHANRSPSRIAVENLLLAVSNTCDTATEPRLKRKLPRNGRHEMKSSVRGGPGGWAHRSGGRARPCDLCVDTWRAFRPRESIAALLALLFVVHVHACVWGQREIRSAGGRGRLLGGQAATADDTIGTQRPNKDRQQLEAQDRRRPPKKSSAHL